jgi:hypothetical protein
MLSKKSENGQKKPLQKTIKKGTEDKIPTHEYVDHYMNHINTGCVADETI